MTTFTAEQLFQIVRAAINAAEIAAIAPLPEAEPTIWDEFVTPESGRRLLVSAAADRAMRDEIERLGIVLPEYFDGC